MTPSPPVTWLATITPTAPGILSIFHLNGKGTTSAINHGNIAVNLGAVGQRFTGVGVSSVGWRSTAGSVVGQYQITG